VAKKPDIDEIRRAAQRARGALLAERNDAGVWTGRLSSSALSTATALSAFCVVSRERFDDMITSGVRWLAANQNVDGGWGDTPDSPSNLSTTMLAQAALTLAGVPSGAARSHERGEGYLRRMAGSSTRQRVASLRESYGKDRTFSAPILANCALAGIVGWEEVPPLPFELARLPRSWFSQLRLHVVSYALPALIAVGQLVHRRRPTANPVVELLRDGSVAPTLRRLTEIQPASGGFLEAVPLTSFVVMSLAGAGRTGHPVVRRGLDFLTTAVRGDGSWPIDTNLTTWVTTQAVEALSARPPIEGADLVKQWLLDQQHDRVHLYTGSPPGGWAWTDLPGGVPDADDTSGALIALAHLGGRPPAEAVAAAVAWLLDLQNADGGWPTFCRGWGKLPFDRSAPDLTAHALRAIGMCRGCVGPARESRAIRRGFHFLGKTQSPDGSWRPLWFGNQHTPDGANPVYGTARVLAAYRDFDKSTSAEARRGVAFLLGAENADGGWGGASDVPSTLEETALAVRALAAAADESHAAAACLDGCTFLARRFSEPTLAEGAPIGLYFASLWYAETLYRLIWSVAAFDAVLGSLSRTEQST